MCVLPLAGAFAQQSGKAKSKDQYYEKEQALPAADLSVRDAKSFTPLKGVSVRLLYMTPQGYMDKRGISHVFELKEEGQSAKIANYKWSDFGPEDVLTDEQGKATISWKSGVKQLLLLRLKGYLDQVLVLTGPPAMPLKIALQRYQPCVMRAEGKVLTARYGFPVVGAEVRLVPAATGEAVKTYTESDGTFSACVPVQGKYTAWVLCEGFNRVQVPVVVTTEKSEPVEAKLAAAFADATRQEIGFISGTPEKEGLLLLDSLAIGPVSTSIEDHAKHLLDELVRLMKKYPESEVDLVCYTPVKGRPDLNQALSDERARNARSYLAISGVPPHRIRVSGKGGTEPRNHCREGVPCTDGEHERNSRFEVRLRREPKE